MPAMTIPFLRLAVAALVLGVACGGATTPPNTPQVDGPSDAAVTCAAAGGTCTGVGSCGAGQGHLGDPKYTGCGGASMVCCFTPGTSCGGAETFLCCSATAQFRPTCTDGKLACGAGLARCQQDAGAD